MITCILLGGLGNQLFQVFNVISLSLSNNEEFCFDISKQPLGIPKRNVYWFTFFRNLNKYYVKNIIVHIKINEKSFNYNPLPLSFDKHIVYSLYGYFQSFKYFHEYKEKIFELLNLNLIKKYISTKLNIDFTNIISIHFRIGDYKYKQDCHPILPIEYYINSLNFIKEKDLNFNNKKFLYIFEHDDLKDVYENINIIRKHFSNTFIYIDKSLSDWEQLITMSLCKYNIIANSSFSWWGSYFNENNKPIICYPSLWFGEKLNNNTKDLFLKEWNRIEII
jgi:hypothetical protein